MEEKNHKRWLSCFLYERGLKDFGNRKVSLFMDLIATTNSLLRSTYCLNSLVAGNPLDKCSETHHGHR